MKIPNLSEKYPGYFNKKILRATFLICLVFITYLFVASGFKLTQTYMKCEDPKGCLNPFYKCDKNFICHKSSICDKKPEFCENLTLKEGEEIGNYNFLYQNNNQISIGIILLGFLLNHVYYKRKNGKPNNN